MPHERVACILPKSLDKVNNSRGEFGFNKQFNQLMGTYRGFFRRLEDNGIAFQQGRQNRPERDRDREVPRGNTPDNPFRLAQNKGIFVGDFAVYNLAV